MSQDWDKWFLISASQWPTQLFKSLCWGRNMKMTVSWAAPHAV